MMQKQDNASGTESQELSALVDVSYLQTGLTVEVYEHGLRLIDETVFPKDAPPRSWTRNPVTEFTSRSRNRLFRTFSKVRTSGLSKAKMITLTYHYGFRKPDDCLKNDLRCFLQWMRDRCDCIHYIWRIEFQERGAIHFHIIAWSTKNDRLFNRPSFDKAAAEAWSNIADPKSEAHRLYGYKSNQIHDFRHAVCYISKYVAKVSEHSEKKFRGRRWASSYYLPTKPIADVTISRSLYRSLQEIIISIITPHMKTSTRFLADFKDYKDVFVYVSPQRLLDACIEHSANSPPDRDIESLTAILRQFTVTNVRSDSSNN